MSSGTVFSRQQKQSAQSMFRKAQSLTRKGRLQESAAEWIAGLTLAPDYSPGYLELARLCRRLQQEEAALQTLHSGLRVSPESGEMWREVGLVYRSLHLHEKSVDSFVKALELDPGDVESRIALGRLFLESQRPEEARYLFTTATAWTPANWHAHYYAGVAARTCGRLEDAEKWLREAIRLGRNEPVPWTELGRLLREQRRYEEAEQAYRHALKLGPRFTAAWHNLANLLVELLRLDEAERAYTDALAIEPDYAQSRVGRAMIWLLQGRFSEGWQEYKWRWQQPGHKLPKTGCPNWSGTDPNGKTILLVSEQGAGDTIQFVRYARQLRDRGATVWLMCRPELYRLLQHVDGLERVVTQGDSLKGPDLACSLLDVPRLLGTDATSIPVEPGYLPIPPQPVAESRVTIAKGCKIGLIWAGNPNHPNDRNRSCLLGDLLHALPGEGVSLFSFQVGDAARQIRYEPENRLVHLAPVLEDYAATAANLVAMDAVVTVDTSVAHLAGALGKPTALLLPLSPDWRWLLNRDDSPWYPSVRLFRQTQAADWGTVWAGLRRWLEQLINGRN